jgi:hypothetical protein
MVDGPPQEQVPAAATTEHRSGFVEYQFRIPAPSKLWMKLLSRSGAHPFHIAHALDLPDAGERENCNYQNQSKRPIPLVRS